MRQQRRAIVAELRVCLVGALQTRRYKTLTVLFGVGTHLQEACVVLADALDLFSREAEP